MLVSELINQLSKFDPSMKVAVIGDIGLHIPMPVSHNQIHIWEVNDSNTILIYYLRPGDAKVHS